MSEHKGFFLYLDQFEPIEDFTLEQKGMLLEAMFAYNAGLKVDISDPEVGIAFKFFKQTFERDKQRYEDKCAKMRDNAAKKQKQPIASNCDQKQPIASRSTQQQEQKQEQQTFLEETSLREVVAATASTGDQQPENLEAEEKPEKNEKPEVPPCPHKQILALYHELLPELPRMKIWDGARQQNLTARWRERWKAGKYATQAGGLDFWRRLFVYIGRDCDWLMGRAENYGGRKPFQASLDWIVKPQNFAKIIEGKYYRREAA